MSRAFWVVASDGSVVQKTEDEARMLYQAGYAEPVQLVGGDNAWVDADVFGLRDAPPPVAAPQYWVVDSIGVVKLLSRPEAIAYYNSGYEGLTMPLGTDDWISGVTAGLTEPPVRAPDPVLVPNPAPLVTPVVKALPDVQASETPWLDPVFHCGYAIIDTETGGLQAPSNPLLSVAVVLADEHMNRIDGFSLKVKPPEGSVLEVPIPAHIGDDGNYKRKVQHFEDLYTGEILTPVQAQGRYVVTAVAAETNGFVTVVTNSRGVKEWDRGPQQDWMAHSLPVEQVDATYVKFLSQFFAARPLPVAHNAQFDEKFVKRYLPNFYAQLHGEWFCTYRTLSGMRKRRGESTARGMCTLEAMAKYANHINLNPHEALADAEACLAGLKWLKTVDA